MINYNITVDSILEVIYYKRRILEMSNKNPTHVLLSEDSASRFIIEMKLLSHPNNPINYSILDLVDSEIYGLKVMIKSDYEKDYVEVLELLRKEVKDINNGEI